MTINEFNHFIKDTGNTFIEYPDYKHLVFMDNEELLMRIVGLLFQSHLNQNQNCPSESEFDFGNLMNETDADTFFYDYTNYFENTCEFKLIEAFINLCILCYNIDFFPELDTKDENENISKNYKEDIDDDEFDVSEMVLKCISLIPHYYDYYDTDVDYNEKYFFIQNMLLNIHQLITALNGDLVKFVNLKKKFEELDE